MVSLPGVAVSGSTAPALVCIPNLPVVSYDTGFLLTATILYKHCLKEDKILLQDSVNTDIYFFKKIWASNCTFIASLLSRYVEQILLTKKINLYTRLIIMEI